MLNDAAAEEGGYDDDDFEMEGQAQPSAPAGPPPAGGGGGRAGGGRAMSAVEILKGAAQKVQADERAESIAGGASITSAARSLEVSLDPTMDGSGDAGMLGLLNEQSAKRGGYKDKGKENAPAVEMEASSSDEDEEGDEEQNMQLVFASYHGDMNALDRLLERGAQALCRDRHGWTPVHHAAAHGHTAAVRNLLDSLDSSRRRIKATRKAERLGGFTPLHVAVVGNHVDTARLLVEKYSADVTRLNLVGDSPRDCIVLRGRKGREMAGVLGVKLKSKKHEAKDDDGAEESKSSSPRGASRRGEEKN